MCSLAQGMTERMIAWGYALAQETEHSIAEARA